MEGNKLIKQFNQINLLTRYEKNSSCQILCFQSVKRQIKRTIKFD